MSKLDHITLPARRSLLKRTAGIGALCLLGGRATPVLSQQSVTIGAVGVKFDPLFVFIEPGDTVNWQGMAGHNVESIDQMVPEGQEKFNTTLGEDVSIVFNTPGIVMYKCTPHWGTRMGGGIVVGKPEDALAIVEGYTAAIESDRGMLLPAKGLLKKLSKEIQGKGW
ncbi:MAG: plastocyanin/azurin family copper-binding protein [Granulosicoccus sp.]